MTPQSIAPNFHASVSRNVLMNSQLVFKWMTQINELVSSYNSDIYPRAHCRVRGFSDTEQCSAAFIISASHPVGDHQETKVTGIWYPNWLIIFFLSCDKLAKYLVHMTNKFITLTKYVHDVISCPTVTRDTNEKQTKLLGYKALPSFVTSISQFPPLAIIFADIPGGKIMQHKPI
jgi:hypothetical protein